MNKRMPQRSRSESLLYTVGPSIFPPYFFSRSHFSAPLEVNPLNTLKFSGPQNLQISGPKRTQRFKYMPYKTLSVLRNQIRRGPYVLISDIGQQMDTIRFWKKQRSSSMMLNSGAKSEADWSVNSRPRTGKSTSRMLSWTPDKFQ